MAPTTDATRTCLVWRVLLSVMAFVGAWLLFDRATLRPPVPRERLVFACLLFLVAAELRQLGCYDVRDGWDVRLVKCWRDVRSTVIAYALGTLVVASLGYLLWATSTPMAEDDFVALGFVIVMAGALVAWLALRLKWKGREN